MCYKIDLAADWDELVDEFNICSFVKHTWHPQRDIKGFSYPSLPVVTQGPAGRELNLMNWGMPAPHPGAKLLLNARVETMTTLPSFRNAAHNQHCLVPVTAYHEWRHIGKTKEEYILHTDNFVFTLAGLWTGTRDRSFAIVTTAASGIAAWVHNTKKRMPLVIKPDERTAWLDPQHFPTPSQADASIFHARRLASGPLQGELT